MRLEFRPISSHIQMQKNCDESRVLQAVQVLGDPSMLSDVDGKPEIMSHCNLENAVLSLLVGFFLVGSFVAVVVLNPEMRQRLYAFSNLYMCFFGILEPQL